MTKTEAQALIAETIRDAVHDVNEGEPLTERQWDYIALQALGALIFHMGPDIKFDPARVD